MREKRFCRGCFLSTLEIIRALGMEDLSGAGLSLARGNASPVLIIFCDNVIAEGLFPVLLYQGPSPILIRLIYGGLSLVAPIKDDNVERIFYT